MKKIYLTRGKVALVDDADWDYLQRWSWQAQRHRSGKYYAVRAKWTAGKSVKVSMSRVILGLVDPKVFAEHKNGNTLDNRRENLRSATNAQNQANTGLSKQNTKGVKGVAYIQNRRSTKKWRAMIRIARKHKILGYFATKEEAAIAYQKKAVRGVW